MTNRSANWLNNRQTNGLTDWLTEWNDKLPSKKMTVLAETWATDWLTETTYQLQDYIWITLTSYYYQLRKLLTITWETDRLTNRLTLKQSNFMKKLTDSLTGQLRKPGTDRHFSLSTAQLTPWSAQHLKKRWINWLHNWRWDQFSDWNVYEMGVIYIPWKSVIWWKKKQILFTGFKFLFFTYWQITYLTSWTSDWLNDWLKSDKLTNSMSKPTP